MGAIRSWSRIAARAGLVLGSALLASAGGAIGVLLATSRGWPRPFLDDDGRPLPGSISEKVFVEINGLRQGMFIKGRDVRKPVLLCLHGGIPDLFLTEKYPTGLEDLFTVVWWEQRGAGMSYRADLPTESLTLDQFVSDTIAVTNYLRERFGPDRIYLMGHSGGSFVGIHAVARAPALYRAFIGVAQMTNQLRSELLAYDYMLAEFKRRGDRAMLRRLEAAPVTLAGGTPRAYLAIRDMAMHRLGIGTMHDMRSIVTGLILPSLNLRRVHPVREDQPVARQGTLGRELPMARGPRHRPRHGGPRARRSRVFPPRRPRLHVLLRPREGVRRHAPRAGEGVLHVRALGAQPAVRGTLQDPTDPPYRCPHGRNQSRRPIEE